MNKKDWFKKRWDKMGDAALTEVLKVASPHYTNPDVYFEELVLNEENENIADKRLSVLENLILQDNASKMEVEMERVRLDRNRMLHMTDFSQLADVPLNNEEKKLYRQYRRYLRELPKLIEREQVLKFEVLTFDQWCNKPVVFEGWNK